MCIRDSSDADAVPGYRFNLTVVLVKFVLEVIDAANCFVQLFLHHFENGEDQGKPYDMEQPNFFGLSIAYDPYKLSLIHILRGYRDIRI